MTDLFGVTFLRPHWLFVLPIIGLLALWSCRRAGAITDWERAIDPVLLAALQRLGRVMPGTPHRIVWPAAAAGIIALCLVGPAIEARDASAFRNLSGLVIAMDLSRSVAEGGRLPQALAAARHVTERAGSRPVGLIAYAGDAYVASPLTTDTRALSATIAALDGETVPDPGSRPDRALALARRMLLDAQIIAADIVVVSDGGGMTDDALREAETVAADGGRVSALYVEPTSVPEGTPQRPGRRPLDRIARVGGGLSGDAIDPMGLVDNMGPYSTSSLAASDLALLIWTDYGRYLLALALLPALALFRRALS